MVTLKQWFSTQETKEGRFCPPESTEPCLESFLAVTVGGRDANGIWWAKAGDIVEHLTVPNTAPTPPPAMTYPVPNTNNFEVKQPCLRDYISEK